MPNGRGFRIGEMTDYGAYFSWGNIDPHFSANGTTFDDGYSWGTTVNGPYASTPGSTVPFRSASGNADYTPLGDLDAARNLLGYAWRVPTGNEFTELVDNTDHEIVTIADVVGIKFMKRDDHDVFIFMPAGGRGYDRLVEQMGTGYYWSCSLMSQSNGYAMEFGGDSLNPMHAVTRFYGCSIRAVWNR